MTPPMSDYQHGYDSGRDGAPRDSFESLVSSQEHEVFLVKQIARREADIQWLDAQIERTTTQRENLQQQILPLISSLAAATAPLQQIREQHAAIQAEQAQLLARRAASTPEYSVVGGLFFFVAGLSFLLGDLVISHEIVAYALNIRDNVEAWAFAAGLAMVTVLLKPAYDRLLERPYQTDPARYGARYSRFKLMMAGFALITLMVLGWFRYEAYRTDQLKAAINRSIRQLQQNAQPTDDSAVSVGVDPAMLAQIDVKLQQSGAMNMALVSSPWAMLSFVLSGLLFALAGAVCLGIGLPVLALFWTRWLQIDRRRAVLRKREKALLRELTPLEATYSEHDAHRLALAEQLAQLPVGAELHQQRQALITETEGLANELRLAITDRRIAHYNDGYAKGEAARDLPQSRYSQDEINALMPRPHQAIRQLIRQRLDQQNDQ
ncbi:hypothetical protein J2I47_21505 [Fibrella sp. HMF5335]|uniref:DUF4407 domain-containing protein n=1 Tax=Fibrella rubiginis TaxID=2817060 RepID=A0A939K790_9BACT|nr:hypothetical protein [Fibrella rubiginis]MBO0939146.1 hypothetical protein [Fibrella rubiginis]